MRIGDRDTDRQVLLVAEAGNNHEGDFERAKELVEQAAAAGAGAIKFQTFRTEHFVRPTDRARFERLKRFELSPERFTELSTLARARGLAFISTPLDLESARHLIGIVDALKIASGDNTFYPLLEVVAAAGRPILISAGLLDLEELRGVVDFVRERANDIEIGVLHCVSSYPVPLDQANLSAIPLLARELRATIGYSDHTLGIDAAVAAVALGARIVEKHFTLDKRQSDFRDHQLSADPPELTELARRIAAVESSLGDGTKRPQPCEIEGRVAYRRSISAAVDLPTGHRLGSPDLTWVRPGGGVPPGAEAEVLGRVLRRPLVAGDQIRVEDLEP